MHKHIYHIHGMTCDGCRTHIEAKLNEIEGIQATVSLEKEQVEIESATPPNLPLLQQKLAELGTNYHIHEYDPKHTNNSPVQKETADSASGQYICPMFCEGHDKTYPKKAAARYVICT